MSETTSNSVYLLDKMFPSQGTANDIHAIHLCMERLAAETKLCFFGSIRVGIPVHRDDGSITFQSMASVVIETEEPFGNSLYKKVFDMMMPRLMSYDLMKHVPLGAIHDLLFDRAVDGITSEVRGNSLPVSNLEHFRDSAFPERPIYLTSDLSDEEIVSHIKETISPSPLALSLIGKIKTAIERISLRADVHILVQFHFISGINHGTIRIVNLGLVLGIGVILDILFIEQLQCVFSLLFNNVPEKFVFMTSLNDITAFLSRVSFISEKQAILAERISHLARDLDTQAWGMTDASEESDCESKAP